MSETQESRTKTQEALSRLSSMCQPNQQTWDLSTNDVDAIKHVLDMTYEMADRLARYTGRTVPDEIARSGNRVISGEGEV